MKPSSKKNIQANKQKLLKQTIKYSFHNYLNLTNQQYLFHSLKLMGITQNDYLKETKLSMKDQFFVKNVNPTTTKQFFYIVLKCVQYISTEQQYQTVKMWYMPRTVNEQLQFKKAFFNLLPKLQSKNKIAKKLLLTKNLLMGDTNHQAVIQFLRILTEMALRSIYMQKYSKSQRLIQISINSGCQNDQPNDINRFYVYPFVPMQQNSKHPSLQGEEVNCLKNIMKAHIETYRKKILNLHQKLNKQTQIGNYQEVMARLLQQKQINEKLTKKIPKNVLSQNRAFDRRILIDKNIQIWKQINKVQCNYVQKQSVQILKLQGQIDKILLNWNPPSGISHIYDCNQQTKRVNKLKQQCLKSISQIQKLNKKIKKMIQT